MRLDIVATEFEIYGERWMNFIAKPENPCISEKYASGTELIEKEKNTMIGTQLKLIRQDDVVIKVVFWERILEKKVLNGFWGQKKLKLGLSAWSDGYEFQILG